MSEWSEKKLGDIAETTSGGTPDRKNQAFFGGPIPWVKSGELEDTFINDTEETITPEGLKHSAAKLFPSGTLLMAMYGATVGKTALLKIEAATNQAVCAIFPRADHAGTDFLRYALVYQRPEILKLRYGGAQPNISQQVIRNLVVPLPPLAEQRKIATVLGLVQRAIEQQERLIALTTELKRALLQQLFTQGLRGEPQKQTDLGPVPESWEVRAVGSIAQVKGGKRLPKGEKFADHQTPFPYIRVTDFTEFGVDTSDLRFLRPETHTAIRRYTISTRDVYISIAGSIGFTGMVPSELEGANLTENAAKLVLSAGEVDARFLMYFLGSEAAQKEIRSQTVKNAQPKLALARIASLKIPIPVIGEQREIVAVLDSLGQKQNLTRRKHAALTALFRTLLHQLMTAQIRIHALDLPELESVEMT